ncbi:MAG: SpoIIE family protein phosphatase [Prevotella sp.]|nr:SpoIIE family protein phosphatase [Prevotella sp.]
MKCINIILAAVATIGLFSCGSGGTSDNTIEADQLINSVYQTKDYPRLLHVADSLFEAGELSEASTYYWQGYAYDRMMQLHLAEFYWKAAMARTEDSNAPGDLELYAKTASRLTNVLSVRGEYEAALEVAEPAVEHLRQAECDTTGDYTNLLIYIGCCQSRFGMSYNQADDNFEQAYQRHTAAIEGKPSEEAYKNAIAGVINIAYNYNSIGQYDKSLTWCDRYGELIMRYENYIASTNNYADKQWARRDIYRAIALEGLGRQDEAVQVYDHYLTTNFSQTPEGHILGNDYLVEAGRWEEAAANYDYLDELLGTHDADYSLENIQKYVLRKYHANIKAGRQDSAVAVSFSICNRLDSAIVQARRLDADEQTMMHQQELEMEHRQTEVSRQRILVFLLITALLLMLFGAYAYYRRRAEKRLTKAHDDLKKDYDRIEKTTTDKERTGSELRIANDIQKQMASQQLPRRNDVSLAASMTQAKAVGSNLYDYVLREDKLFICIGDTNMKGAQASLIIAMTKAQFRALVAIEDQPKRIMEAMNDTMARAGGSTMALTLFVGVLNLSDGRLLFCNAGHEAPVLAGSGVGLLPVDSNLPMGKDARHVFTQQDTLIDPGTVILLYTKGLAEAANSQQQHFGQNRIMGEALQALKSGNMNPQDVIDGMARALKRFTGDTEQTADITMLVVRYTGQTNSGHYQRSTTLTNDEAELPRLSQYVSDVCQALKIDKAEAATISEAIEEAVVNAMKHAYPEGKKGNVNIEVRAEKEKVSFVVRDRGIAYDPTKAEDSDLNLAKRNMDSMEYERKADVNILTLTKKLAKA